MTAVAEPLAEVPGADHDDVLAMLNRALAIELVSALRYRRHAFIAQGLAARPVVREVLVQANEELALADVLAARIVQLGGSDNPLARMIHDDLASERDAIDSYRAMIDYLCGDTSRPG